MDDSGLDRFVGPVTEHLDIVIRELDAGLKQSHWMWFMFPQLRRLGRSDTAKYYGLTGIDEACQFLRHPVLGPTFEQLVAMVHHVIIDGHRSVHDVFGDPDDLKLVSSLTLFAAAADREGRPDLSTACLELLAEAERQGLPKCAVTRRAIAAASD